LHGAKLLQPASYAAMTTPVGAAAARSYGFGIGKATIGPRTMLTHGGGIPGFLTANLYVPEAELSVTVLTNGDAKSPDDLAVQLARVALGVPSDPKPARVAVSSEELRRYTGTYSLVLGTARPFTVTEKDGKAFGQLEGQPASEMVPLGNHTFGADFDPTVRIIFTVVNDRSTKMTLQQRGQEFEGLRVP
jgi:D-alanyl-D-alanine carboxypeptidase